MDTKICNKCGAEQPLDKYSKNSPSQGKGYSGTCKKCVSKRSVAWTKSNRDKVNAYHKTVREKKKAYVNALKANPCTDCGNSFPPVCMDFDHLPQYEKSFEINQAWARKLSLNKILEEIKKCELVCSNCHRIRGEKRKNEKKGVYAMLDSIREELDLKETLERDVLDSIKAGSKFVADDSDEE
jgi:hypothetical protein